MHFISSSHTDIGLRKKTNQDSLCIKIAKTRYGEVCMLVVCDGMGGLQKGELASATVVRRFSTWFNRELPDLLAVPNFTMATIKNSWENMINQQNDLVYRYGVNENIQLGTTLTVILIVNDAYITAQLGDSRAYKIEGSAVSQITKDQSVVARDVAMGIITEEQAKKDSRRNVLLQCLGAAKNIHTEYESGKYKPGTGFLLCSDGFVHELANNEISGLLAPNLIKSENDIKSALVNLIDLVKKRGETDNITAVCVKAY